MTFVISTDFLIIEEDAPAVQAFGAQMIEEPHPLGITAWPKGRCSFLTSDYSNVENLTDLRNTVE